MEKFMMRMTIGFFVMIAIMFTFLTLAVIARMFYMAPFLGVFILVSIMFVYISGYLCTRVKYIRNKIETITGIDLA